MKCGKKMAINKIPETIAKTVTFSGILSLKLYNLKDPDPFTLSFAHTRHKFYVEKIIERVRYDINRYIKYNKKALECLKKQKKVPIMKRKIPNYVVAKLLNSQKLLTLDLESLFIFLRIYLDTMCKVVIRLRKGKGYNLPHSMNRLLFTSYEKYKKFDFHFLTKLKKELLWTKRIISDRDNLVHYLHNIALIDRNDINRLRIHVWSGKEPEIGKVTLLKFIRDVELKINHFEDNFLKSYLLNLKT